MNSICLRVSQTPRPALAINNRVYVSKATFESLKRINAEAGIKVDEHDPYINVSFSDLVFQAR